MLTPSTYTPDEDAVAALITRVETLVAGANRNCFAGSVKAYDRPGPGIPHLAVFVSVSGGLPSREFKGTSYGTRLNERRPLLSILVRSGSKGNPTAFQDGQTLAREVFEALHHDPPSSDYCESEALNSHPSYLGRDEDGHHEWLINVQLIVDVVYS